MSQSETSLPLTPQEETMTHEGIRVAGGLAREVREAAERLVSNQEVVAISNGFFVSGVESHEGYMAVGVLELGEGRSAYVLQKIMDE
jgi:hypothetical protein